MSYRRIASLKTTQAFQDYFKTLGIDLPFDERVLPAPESPLAQPFEVYGLRVNNRFATLPMEGWDGTPEGIPTELTIRRWKNFGKSGAKLIWGGEAVAVHPDGRANPYQLLISRQTLGEFGRLRQALVDSHQAATGGTEGLVTGLQLTHSGRYSRPQGKPQPRLAYDHPLLNRRMGLSIPSGAVLTDGEVEGVIEHYVAAADLAYQAGFDFVDIKHCHGYLLHEFLSAVDRDGKYGGSLENRTRPGREIINGIQSQSPALKVAVRLSAFDFMPFCPGPDQTGIPELEKLSTGYIYAFGGDESGIGMNLAEPLEFIRMLQRLGVELMCITAGSPYYNPHIQRPALFPPSDGYQPPEDPLVGVARQIAATSRIKKAFPDMFFVGSAYSYLQEWLPHIAQAAIRLGLVDSVGLGRMLLAYPEMPADILAGRSLQRQRICRSFSDCTTAPRAGLVSGCYPLDPYYKNRQEYKKLAELKHNKK